MSVTAKARIAASPLARRLAKENQLDLTQFIGTGPSGRIIKRDIQTALQKSPLPPATSLAADPTLPDPRLFFSDDAYEVLPLSPMMQAIAKRLQTAKQEIPHYQVSMDIPLDRALVLRTKLNQILADEETGEKLTLNDFIIRAVALALLEVPQVNVSFAGDSLLRFKQADISVAVALPDGGLITPIIKSANTKSVREIAKEVKTLAARAVELRLQPTEYEGGTFTISNLGMFGVAEFNAIINPPQAAILAVAASEMRFQQAENEQNEGNHAPAVQLCQFMRVTLSCDHRAINGAEAAKFLNAFKTFMASPLSLFF